MAPRRRTLTLEVLNEMRQRAKTTNDPAAQLEYAKALIEAAVIFGNDDPDPRRQRKNKEALFMEGLRIIKRLATTGMGIGKPAYPAEICRTLVGALRAIVRNAAGSSSPISMRPSSR